jgi:uncharacterized membrane protein YfcA
MIPVVAVGAWRQHRFANVAWKAASIVGVASAAGVAGVALAASLPEDVLRRLFAGLLVVTAVHLVMSRRRS